MRDFENVLGDMAHNSQIISRPAEIVREPEISQQAATHKIREMRNNIAAFGPAVAKWNKIAARLIFLRARSDILC
jgi:hypothetical protein